MRLIDADEYKKRISHYPNIKPIAFKELRYVKTLKDYVPIKYGHWINGNDNIIIGTCSVCGWNAINGETDVSGMPYCPNCGAKMDEVEDAEKTD